MLLLSFLFFKLRQFCKMGYSTLNQLNIKKVICICKMEEGSSCSKLWCIRFENSLYGVNYVCSLPCQLGLYNAPTAPLQRGKTPSMGVLGMILNHLIVRL